MYNIQIQVKQLILAISGGAKYVNVRYFIHSKLSNALNYFILLLTEMATQSIGMFICLLETVKAFQNQDLEHYPYYNPPMTENAIHYSYKTLLKRHATSAQEATLDPGALIGVLALVSLYKNSNNLCQIHILENLNACSWDLGSAEV